MAYLITVNVPGTLPESEPFEVDSLPEALEAIQEEIERTADAEGVDVPEFDVADFAEEVTTWGEFSVQFAGWNHEVRRING